MFQGLLQGFKSFFGHKALQGSDFNFKERRKLIRMLCHYEVRGTAGQKRFKAIVIDIGLQGLKLRTGQTLKIGEKVTLHPPKEGLGNSCKPVEGKVIWIKSAAKGFSRLVGVHFVTDKDAMALTWVKLLLKELGFKPKSIFSRRRFLRADCFLDVRYHAAQIGRDVTGRVYNLGVGGMLMESNYELPSQTPTEMEFVAPEGLPVLRLAAHPVMARKEGTVRLIGLEFRELNEQQLDLLGQYLKVLLSRSFEKGTS